MAKRDRTGKNNAFFGKHHTQEAKEAISETQKKYAATPKGYAQIIKASKLSKTPMAIAKCSASNMGRIPWNKGLTKESDPRVMLWSKPQAEEHKRKRLEAQKVYLSTPEGKKNLQRATLASHTPTAIARCSESLKKLSQNPAMKAKRAEITKRLWQNPKYRERILAAITLAHNTPAYLVGASKRSKQNWENPVYIAKMIKSLAIKPNKLELILQTILDKHFPAFKYNGDYRLGVSLSRMIPDFVNINGKKEVIEVFGDHWHSTKRTKETNNWKDTELGKIMAYGSIGYKCLVVWEKELKNPQAVIKKIRRWQNGKKGK